MNQQLDRLEKNIGVSFHKRSLLEQAFTHSSYVNEQKSENEQDNERLEFLGDAVLELTVSDYLYETYPKLPEGDLTKLRASIVCEASLVYFAKKLQFGEFVQLGKGEEMTGGRSRPSLLADLFEAFVGALYLDQGLERVKQFLREVMFSDLSDTVEETFSDYKTQLQEWTQHRNMDVIAYRIIEESGPAHSRHFVSEVFIGEESYGQGTGRSKKEAEQQAAAQALQSLLSSKA